MERAFALWKPGYCVLDDCDKKEARRYEFSDAHYGDRTRTWYKKMNEITDARWDCIVDDANAFMSEDSDDVEDEAEEGSMDQRDPRMRISLDW